MRNVQLPAALCQAAEQRFADRFGSIEQLLIFVLQEVLRDDAVQMDEKEQKLIQQRLRDLGYV